MPEGAPDWTKAVKIYGVDEDGNVVGVLLNPQGRMEALIKAWDGVDLHTLLTDLEGRLITVLRDPTNDRYLAINAAGQLEAVMTGLHGVTSKILQTDDIGRLQAIIIDPEDVWGKRPTIGLAELAARLGSIVTFERRGEVTFLDSFEFGVNKWQADLLGDDSFFLLSVERVYHQGYSGVLNSGDGADPQCIIAHVEIHHAIPKMLGFEVRFSSDANCKKVIVSVGMLDGTDIHVGEVHWVAATGVIEYVNSGGIDTPTGLVIPYTYGASAFPAIKLVLDLEHDKYDRIYFEQQEYDLSGFDLFVDTDGRARATIYAVGILGDGATPTELWVDSVVVTNKEPEE